MVNPLRVPLVLMAILVGMVLFVHSHRPRPSDATEADKADELRLRKANDLFLTSNVREQAVKASGQAAPTPAAAEMDSRGESAARAPSAAFLPDGGFLKPMPPAGQLPSVLAPTGTVTGQLSPLPAGASKVARTAAVTTGTSSPAGAPRYLPVGPGKGAPVMHRIVDGDTLRDLSARYLGSEARYLEIFEANRDLLVRPDLLPLGVKIRIPLQRP